MGELFPKPVAVTCSSCAAESQHDGKALLALTEICPTCGSSLNDIGIRMGETIDDSAAYYAWLELVIVVAERLDVTISDEDAFDGRESFAALTLRDLAAMVRGHLPPDAQSDERALQVALEAAAVVAKASVEPAAANLPILEALRFTHWAERQGRTSRST